MLDTCPRTPISHRGPRRPGIAKTACRADDTRTRVLHHEGGEDYVAVELNTDRASAAIRHSAFLSRPARRLRRSSGREGAQAPGHRRNPRAVLALLSSLHRRTARMMPRRSWHASRPLSDARSYFRPRCPRWPFARLGLTRSISSLACSTSWAIHRPKTLYAARSKTCSLSLEPMCSLPTTTGRL